MYDETKEAIKNRISIGNTKIEIIQELESAGYPTEVATDLCETVFNEMNVVDKPDIDLSDDRSTALADQQQVVTTEYENETSESIKSDISLTVDDSNGYYELSKNRKYLVFGFLFFLVVSALAGGVYANMSGLFQTSLFKDEAPYSNEAEMMEGMFTHLQSLTAHGFNLDYEMALEPRDPNTPTISEDFFSEEELDNLAEVLTYAISEGFVKFTASGLVDARDKSNPKLDMSMQLNVLAEPFILSGAVSMLVVNDTVYGKIDKFPTNFRQFLSGVPENKWIILQSGLEFDALPSTHPLVPTGGIQAYKEFTPAVVQLYAGEVWRLMTLGHQEVTQVAQEASRQMASGITALGLDTSMGPEERQMIERSLALLKQYPVVRFIGEPEQVNVNEEVLYRYAVDIDYENLQLYFSNLIMEAQSITGQAMPLGELEMDYLLPDREVIDEINRLTDIVLTFRPDGGLAEMTVNGALAFNHPAITSQARLHMSVSYTRQNDGLNITAPADVHPNTLEEIIQESFSSSRVEAQDALIKMTMPRLRATAEMVYNENNYSYQSVCQDVRIIEMLHAMAALHESKIIQVDHNVASSPDKIACNDSRQAYVIAAPLVSSVNKLWCIDSSAFSGEVAANALSSGSDTSCK